MEQQSDLQGGLWVTSALYLKANGLVRRNAEFHHFDPVGAAGVITDGDAAVLSSNLYDRFGVLRFEQGAAETPWLRNGERLGDEGLLEGCLLGRLTDRRTPLMLAKPQPKPPKIPKECNESRSNCEACQDALYQACLRQGNYPGTCYAISLACEALCNDEDWEGQKVYNCWKRRWPKKRAAVETPAVAV